ncbi:MAG: hypothetical protein IPL50_19275 [Chitinophagaceae bacterium]|nr:hypothetical protein [Chitinophagaceae bacterium]
MGDFVGSDVGALTNWSITIDYTTGRWRWTNTYLCMVALAGLYTNATATVP